MVLKVAKSLFIWDIRDYTTHFPTEQLFSAIRFRS